MSSSNSLPKWATYRPYSSSQSLETNISNKKPTNANAAPSSSSAVKIQNEHKILIQNDELILRTKAYHFTCTDIIQRNFDEILCQQIHKNILSPLCFFMTQFQPFSLDCNNNEQKFECSDSTPRKRRRVDKQTKLKDEFYNQILYQTIEQKNYNPELLPIGIVHVQPSVLDRHVIIRALKRRLISTSKIESSVYNPAVCLLSDMDMTTSYDFINVNKNFKKNKVEYLLFSILTQVRFYLSHCYRYIYILLSYTEVVPCIFFCFSLLK